MRPAPAQLEGPRSCSAHNIPPNTENQIPSGGPCDHVALRPLGEAARYRQVLEQMHRDKPRRRLAEVGSDGVSLRALIHEGPRFARLLAEAVATGAYRPKPAMVARVQLDKERELYRFTAADFVVHTLFAELLGTALEPRLSPRLYSYRAGRSSFVAVRALAAYVRAHRAAQPDPFRRGLHLLHCDVQSYGESVPLGERSRLWPELSELVGDHPLVRALVRPEVRNSDGAVAVPLVGLPTGSPIATVVTNLYLGAADRVLDAIPGSFYARYGDDLLFIHPDADQVAQAERRLEEVLAQRGLRANPSKRQRRFWNGAGRSEASGEVAGTTHITFLGTRIAFDGTVGLPPAKLRLLLVDLRARVRRAAIAAAHLIADDRPTTVCAAIRTALDPRSPCATAYAPWLRSIVTDRRQLRAIDHELAQAIATALTGRSGPRAFRSLPPARLRQLGLPSLVAARNGRR